MRISSALAAIMLLPSFAFAAGGNSAPTQTETSKTCQNGQVWDANSNSCVSANDSSLNDTDRLDAVRELAYAGRMFDAERVLNAVNDQTLDGVLTYRGFLARQLGRDEEANDWYAKALHQNPGNLLARSYLGQAHVKSGNVELARLELSEIRKRGGRQTWAEISLRLAIDSGQVFTY